MSMGYDVAELLAVIKAKDAEIARLAPSNFTEAEIELTIRTMLDAHTPDRVHREVATDAASVIRKLQARLDAFAAARRAAADFAASLTDEERRLILERRRGR